MSKKRGAKSNLFRWLALPVILAVAFNFMMPLLGNSLAPSGIVWGLRIARTVPGAIFQDVLQLTLGLTSIANFFHTFNQPIEIQTLEHVLSTTAKNDIDGILASVDARGYAGFFMYNTGDVKGKILDDALRPIASKKDLVAVELGTYLGYGTLRMARIAPKARIITADPGAMSVAVSTTLFAHAGVKIDMRKLTGAELLQQLAAENIKINFLYIDHMKTVYLSDIQLAIKLGLLADGAVVVADNILKPGAPDYKAFMLANPCFQTSVHNTTVEYLPFLSDEMTVSTFTKGEKCL